MGKAIILLSIVVLCSFAFVLSQLMRSQPRRDNGPAASPLMESADDGSIYSVGSRLRRYEERLVEEERRSQKQQADLERSRQENQALRRQLDELAEEVRALRAELQDRPIPPLEPPSEPPGSGAGFFTPTTPGPDLGSPIRP
jgi:septal ring factor EnvC (AmiA/AmiB activator)